MLILEDFYSGKINPSAKTYRKGTEYARLNARALEDIEHFREGMSDAEKKIFDDYETKQSKMGDIEAQEAFIEGVRFGARFILDVINPAESQFEYIGS